MLRPYVTAKFWIIFFTSLYGLGHPSQRATKPLINTRFVWHGMNIDVANWCRSCKSWQTSKISCHNKPFFGKITEQTERSDCVPIDIVSPLQYCDGFKYLLTCVNRFTHMPEAYSGSQSQTTRRGRASCSLWYAPVAND